MLLERGYTRSMRQEKRFRTGWAFLFILACYVPMFGVAFPWLVCLRCAVSAASGGHGRVFDASSVAAHAAARRSFAAWPRAGNIDIGAAIYTAVQMGLLAGCFALTCGSIARQCGARAAKRAAVFFALLSAAYGDGGERDERRAVRWLFCADARFFERDEREADPQPVCRKSQPAARWR